MSTHTLSFNSNPISFDVQNRHLMVNATEMAKVFGKKPVEFLSNANTKAFINECLTGGNSHQFGFEKEEDIVWTKDRSGTYMHRILALKFAAWLNPAFELWVYATIDDILFGSYREMEAGIRASAERTQKIRELENRLREMPDFADLERLKLEERQAKAGRSRIINTQLRLFIDEE